MKRFIKNLTKKGNGNNSHDRQQPLASQQLPPPPQHHSSSPARPYAASTMQQQQQHQQQEGNITYLYPNHAAPAILQHQQQTPPPPRSSPPRPQANGNGSSRIVTTTVQRVPPPSPHADGPPAKSSLSSPARTATNKSYNNQTPTTPVSTTSDTNNTTSTTIIADNLSSTNDSTRNLVKRFIADIWNRGEIDLIPDVCSSQLRFNGNTGFDRIGHDGLARMVATIRDALDDYHCEIHSMVVENNKAFCRLRFTGKHTGPLLGYAPTKKVVAWMGATEFTCLNGKILKVWELGDVKSLEEQLMPDHAPGQVRNGGIADMEI